ncbi:hypothetical protein AAVH_19752 [Aphelenchoides avenae]|nr:hypothetical protein AAVH_19752 [Aphelenchus avenae]
MSWNNGSALCAKHGGHLVTIPSFEVNYRIMGVDNTQDMWIGYRRNATTNTWSWANGAKSTFTLWQFGSPDTNRGGDCAALQGSAGGFWYNLGCDYEQAYVICERAPFDWHPNTV